MFFFLSSGHYLKVINDDKGNSFPGCNIVDIGAHTGDTAMVLAVAAKGGKVVAFEMGAPVDILRLNTRWGTKGRCQNTQRGGESINLATFGHE